MSDTTMSDTTYGDVALWDYEPGEDRPEVVIYERHAGTHDPVIWPTLVAALTGNPVADELERQANLIDGVPDPAGDAWLRAETAGRREVKRGLLARAAELRAGA
jgi:hypothetical protein